MIATTDPTTGRELERFDETSPAEVERALDEAASAFRQWRARPLPARCELVRRAAASLDAHRPELARLITLEMGKTLREASAEVAKCALACRWFADRAPELLAAQAHPSEAGESYVEFPPLGVVLAVMPWNFPFWQVFRFAAPALVAGNVALLKHASNVPRCALAIERVFAEAGFARGVFRTLLLDGAHAEALVDDPRVAALTLTGSAQVGAQLARRSGGALKKAVLELGGSDPFVVLADADVEEAARVAVRARFQNAGQSCIAAKRFIVEAPVHERFLEAFTVRARGLVAGDPLEEETDLGPLARSDLRDALEDQVRRSIDAGARVVLRGGPLDRPGWFYAPTVLAGVQPGMAVFDEETFGPVAAVVRAGDEGEAVALANRTEYGLGANLWTRDLERAKRLAPRLEAGNVFVNGMVASTPSLPFGGIKHSGWGRELSGYGLREFTNVQTVWIGPAR